MNLLLPLFHSQQVVPLLAPVSLIVFLLNKSLSGRWAVNPFRNKATVWFVFLSAYVLILSVVNSSGVPVSLGYFSSDGRIIYCIVLFVIVSLCVGGNEDKVSKLAWGYVNVSFIIALFSLALMVTNVAFEIKGERIGVMYSGRTVLVGLLGTKNPYAGVTGASILTLLLIKENNRFNISSFKYWFMLSVLFLALVFTASRGFFMATIGASIFYYLFIKKQEGRLRLSSLFLVFFVCVIFFLVFYFLYSESVDSVINGTDQNVLRRFQIYYRALDIILESFVFGIGPGNYSLYNLDLLSVLPGFSIVRGGVEVDSFVWQGSLPIGQHTHNFILQTLVDIGFSGCFIYFGVQIYLIFKAKREAKENIHGNLYYELSIVFFVYLAIGGLVAGYTFMTPSITFMYLLVLAYLVKQEKLR